MKQSIRNTLISILSLIIFIGFSSFILLNMEEINDAAINGPDGLEQESTSQPLTSTGDFLGFYTTLSTANPPIPLNIDVVSFPSMNGAPTTISAAWNSYSFTQVSAFLPTNGTTYDPLMKEVVGFISGELQYLQYKDNPMSVNMGPMTFPVSAPVFLNGQYLAILVEDGGYATPPMLEADLVIFDPNFGNFSSVQHLQTTTPNPFTYFTHESMSSATNRVGELYFLSGTNLVIVTDFSIFTPHYCWIDLEPSNSSNNYHSFYGVEYKSPGVLLAIRETFVNNTPHLDLVEIYYNSTTCTVSSIVSVYDLQSNIPSAPGGWIINSEYYSTAFDSCRSSYYISSLYDAVTSSRLIEIDIPNSSHVEQILPQYLFGIEWKQKPCPCDASFAFQQFSSCDKFNFINTSTGSTPMTCHWNFGDPNSGINNTSTQCVEMHQFSSCGNFTVCLTINANGCMDNFCQTITVTDNVPPVALCKSNVVVTLDVNCMATLQTTDIDNGSFDDCNLQSLSLDQTMFNACGIYPVTLTATDWCGNTSVCNTVVQIVDNFPPVIICPVDVYLTTIDPNCTMIVNGLQWIALADNCGIATIMYTVTGDTQHSGVGDASGLLFNEGISFVTYTVTDNCGNTTSCSFEVVLDCICECPNNLIQNPGFYSGAIVGYLNAGGHSNNWHEGQKYPAGAGTVWNNNYCCDAFAMYLVGYSTSGQSIYQQGLQLLSGHQYKISFCAKVTVEPIKFGFTATNTPVTGGFDPYNCSNCENIGITAAISPIPLAWLFTSSGWISYTIPIWTATLNWDVLFLRAIGSTTNGGIGLIDNICVEEVFYSCCEGKEAFIENTNNALNVRSNQETMEGVFEAGNLMECNSIDYIDWGDGTITDGPLLGNTTVLHAYTETGTYRVEYKIREFDPQDTSQLACFSHVFLDSIVILPDTCFCGDFSTMQFSWGPNLTQPVFCGINPPVLLGCPSTGNGYDFTGAFFCNGTICPRQSAISWSLSGPGGNYSGTTTANPYFGITILPSYVSQPGTYTLSLSGQCGDQNCFCFIQFVVDCPNLCPCNQVDILALGNAVDMGYSHSSLSNSCQVCFSPIALSNCETVEWHLNTITPTPIGTSNGNQSFCHTFPGAGTYTLIMVVNRKKSDGSDCETFTFSKQVTVQCQTFPTCNDPAIRNPNFTEGAVAGALGFGGMITGWKVAAGAPIITQGLEGTQDEWSVLVRGNKTYADILETEEAICLDEGIGVISARIGMGPQPTRPTRPCDILRVAFSADSNVKIIAEVPLTNLDSSEWWQVDIPFDVSDWIGLNDCSGNPGTILAHLQISVSNGLDDSQGGPLTFTEIYVDNVCLDNLVFISDPVLSEPVHIHPNPNGGEFVIELPDPASEGTSIRIMDLRGNVIMEKKAEAGKANQLIEANDLPSGMYFIQIVSDGRVMSMDKFVKI